MYLQLISIKKASLEALRIGNTFADRHKYQTAQAFYRLSDSLAGEHKKGVKGADPVKLYRLAVLAGCESRDANVFSTLCELDPYMQTVVAQ